MKKRTPLPLPQLNRVDVRTIGSSDNNGGKGTKGVLKKMNHRFGAENVWQQTLNLQHPILSSHKAYEQHLLPGLAYIDLLYQWFAEAGFNFQQLELHNLSIYYPLNVTPDYSIKLDISAENRVPGVWNIIVCGTQLNHDQGDVAEENNKSLADGSEKIYAKAEMHEVEAVSFNESHDPDKVITDCYSSTPLDEMYHKCRDKRLVHSGVMKAEGTVNFSDKKILIQISVCPEQQGTVHGYMFHPVLVDGSGVGEMDLFSQLMGQKFRMFLPMYFSSFRASELFHSSCITKINRSDVQLTGELLSSSMAFFNSKGHKIAELKGFTNKLVRMPGLINPALSTAESLSNSQDIPQEELPGNSFAADLNATADTMETLLHSIIKAKLSPSPEELNSTQGYYELGLNSAMLLEIVTILESKLALSLSPTLLFEYTNIAKLAKYLAKIYDRKSPTQPESTDNASRSTKASSSTNTEISTNSTFSVSAEHGNVPQQNENSSVTDQRQDIPTIAVIGLAGRYPKAGNMDEFWKNLKAGKDCVTEIPSDRWDWKQFDHIKLPNGRSLSKWGGFIDQVDCFDALFFRISPREAESMDPQERLFLEVCWETLEDAGYTPENIVSAYGEGQRRSVGVFAGAMHKDYSFVGADALAQGKDEIPLTLNYAPIPNRVSYFFNFHGPSIAVDTVCSGSLTAVHLAIESIIRGESIVALAGGVNLSLHPNKYITYGKVGLHSSDGNCRTFGEGGDGYVSAEGVGAVLLKPLAMAEKHRDHIYCVIKGSAINHVGTVGGLTVPSPLAQAEMILDCLDKAAVDPRSITYIEAHGTGTSLGDPIEIKGLTKAFREHTTAENFCALGSVKSNIGHAEGAAGISGLSKTILQLYYKTLVPSLHSETVNPFLELDSSPFYIQHKLQPWNVEPIAGCDNLRRAGVSSFGATGSNAHVILEEYIGHEPADLVSNGNQPVLVPISAMNSENLQIYWENILSFLMAEEEHIKLSSLAYTLQTGRMAFEERLILIAGTVRELIDLLQNLNDGISPVENLWQANIKKNKHIAQSFKGDPDETVQHHIDETVQDCIKEGKLPEIAQLWLQGHVINWQLFYSGTSNELPERMRLPCYPFSKIRYWIDHIQGTVINRQTENLLKTGAGMIHPLLHQNVSDLTQQVFSSSFSGNEFFLADHLIRGERLLPGSAYIEMAYEAIKQSVNTVLVTDNELPENNEQLSIQFNNIVWAKPIVVTDDIVNIHISLTLGDHGEIRFKIQNKSITDTDPVLYCQGRAMLIAKADRQRVGQSRLDLADLKAACNRKMISSDELYTVYKSSGIDYRGAFQSVERIFVGDRQILAKLCLPPAATNTLDQFTLHPCLLDAAFQSVAGLSLADGNAKSVLAFAVQTIHVLAVCQADLWVWVRFSDNSKETDTIQKLDLDIFDNTGKVCVHLKEFSFRLVAEKNRDIADGFKPLTVKTPFFIPVSYPVQSVAIHSHSPGDTDNVLLIADKQQNRQSIQTIKGCCPSTTVMDFQADIEFDSFIAELQAVESIDHIIWIAPAHLYQTVASDEFLTNLKQCVGHFFRLIKAFLQMGYAGKNLAWTVVTCQGQIVHQNETINPHHAAIHGLVGTLAKEYSKWKIRLIDLPLDGTWPVAASFTQGTDDNGDAMAYREGRWFRQELALCQQTFVQNELIKPKGVYVVIGGAGGLGEVWSELIIKAHQAQLIWIGRRAIDQHIQEKIDRLGRLGPAPWYISADASNYTSLQQAYEEIKRRFTHVHGIVHSAIGALDQSLEKISEELFWTSVSPKLDVSVQLARVFQQETLDFVLFFSSMNSFAKEHGKCGYSTGCVFEDAFALRLAQEWSCPVKVMNWGWWDIGISENVPTSFKNRMEQMGFGAFTMDEAGDALDKLLGGPFQQMGSVKLNGKAEGLKFTQTRENVHVYSLQIESVIAKLLAQLGDDAIAEAESREQGRKQNNADALFQEQVIQVNQLEQLLAEMLAGLLYSMDLFEGGTVTLAGMKSKLDVLYHAWLETSLSVLERHAYVKKDKENYTVTDTFPVDLTRFWEKWSDKKSAWAKNKNFNQLLELIENVMHKLPDILTGKIVFREALLPATFMQLTENIHRVGDMDDKLATVVLAYIEERLKSVTSEKIRIFEIAVGAGGISGRFLQRLKPYSQHIEEYSYTNVFQGALLDEEKEFTSEYDFLRYQLFNVEQGLAEQNINTDTYDLVIADNIFYSVRDIRQALRNVKATLKTHGLLLLNEIRDFKLFRHLTLALSEDWWFYDDEALRDSGSPGLSPHSWQTVLESEGYQSVFFPLKNIDQLPQQIIVAESNGVNRQQVTQDKITSDENTAVPLVEQSSESMEATASDYKQENIITDELLRDKAATYFIQLLSKTLKLSSHQIDAAEPMESYGIDSILVVEMTNDLNQVLEDVSSTLFFEHQTIEALTNHFINTQREKLIQLLGLSEIREKQSINEKTPAAEKIDSGWQSKSRFAQYTGMESPSEKQSTGKESIAIIGLSGRYPQALNIDEYWENLKAGKDCITDIPAQRWPLDGFYHHHQEEAIELGKSYCKSGGFIDNFAEFDPLFFNISPRETENMDPQERLFMQCCWEVLEQAAYTRERLHKQHQNRVGVFAGITKNGFNLYGPDLWRQDMQVFPYTSFSSVANRVSYFFNFNGPSMPIDTMCSASLTAIHEACEHILRDECEMAIAGGVNVFLHPSSYILLCSQNMLSIDGKCKTFAAGGNGFVPGEGVGNVLLKRLSRAEKDQDQILAVILATAINHGGKTNGYTVPNPTAQADVISATLQKAQIDSRSISYIEAHGTGTELGDPIEISGLTKAFNNCRFDKKLPDTKQYCAIGSVKSNVGHLESAAGIAGLTKIILQMQFQQLVPSLHTKKLNPKINFNKTPFKVQRTLEHWVQPEFELDGKIISFPRRAGISSFGAGGANAHLILEEYVLSDEQRKNHTAEKLIDEHNPALVVLSAMTVEQLQLQALNLLNEIQRRNLTDKDLAGLAYTLQLGREAMSERLAVSVTTTASLVEKLQTFISGTQLIDDLYKGQIAKEKEALSVFSTDDDLQQAISVWIEKKKFGKLLNFWVKGLKVDWRLLYADKTPASISLPTYPFVRETYWIPGKARLSSPVNPLIHPLVHINTSNLQGLRFTSRFNGGEFFFGRYSHQKALIESVYPEMARVAVENVMKEYDFGDDSENNSKISDSDIAIRFENISWPESLITVEDDIELHISLLPHESGEIDFEIYREQNNAVLKYNEGQASLISVSDRVYIDITELQAQCTSAYADREDFYNNYTNDHLEYEKDLQCIDRIFFGENQLLAKLVLLDGDLANQQQFVLHPGIMNSVIQAASCLFMDDNNQPECVPVVLDAMDILSGCCSAQWAWIRYSDDELTGGVKQKLDIDICDENGMVFSRMNGLYIAEWQQLENSNDSMELASFANSHLLTPIWQLTPLQQQTGTEHKSLITTEKQLLVIGGSAHHLAALQQLRPDTGLINIEADSSIDELLELLKSTALIEHIVWIAANNDFDFLAVDEILLAQNRIVAFCFRFIKALLAAAYDERELAWTFLTCQAQAVYSSETINPLHAGLHGLVGSLAKEYSNWNIRLVDLEQYTDWPWQEIFTLPWDKQGDAWCYRNSQWYRQALLPCHYMTNDTTAVNKQQQACYRENGVYVIIGGAGGIGEIWSEHIITNYQAQLVWIGRREKDQYIQEKLDRLGQLGPVPYYISADASDYSCLLQAYKEIKQQFPNVHGLVHSAVGALDQSLVNMDETLFRNVISTKLDISVNMVNVFQHEQLDFVLFFSSLNSFIKDHGKSGYSAGSLFIDAFAQRLNAEFSWSVKIMNWGFWDRVGVGKALPERMVKRIKNLGHRGIEAKIAMQSLHDLLQGPLHQLVMLRLNDQALHLLTNGNQQQIAVYSSQSDSIIKYLQHEPEKNDSLIINGNPFNDGQSLSIARKIRADGINVDKMYTMLLWGQLQSLGIFKQRNFTLKDVQEQCLDLYDCWLEESLDILVRDGFLSRTKDQYSVVNSTGKDNAKLWENWRQYKKQYLDNPHLLPTMNLLEVTLSALPDILTGKQLATDVMFANSSVQLVNAFNKNNGLANYFNAKLITVVKNYIEKRLADDPSARIRILEIGAGTGGTTVDVLSNLKNYSHVIDEYCYTDISKAFLLHARKEYGPDNSFLNYQLFNIEKPIAEQQITADSYDLVIADNVVHATKNIRQSIRHVKEAMHHRGLLLLKEISSKSLFLHLSFGLLKGWWLSEDKHLRIPGGPGIYPQTWQSILESEGFRSVCFPAENVHDLGLQIVVAESDGVVYQTVKQQVQIQKPLVKTQVHEAPLISVKKTGKISLNAGKNNVQKISVPTSTYTANDKLFRQKTVNYFKHLFGETLHLSIDRINSAEPMEAYGIDSILIVQMTRELAKVFDNVNNTLFFEFKTIDALANHFIQTQKQQLKKLLGLEEQQEEIQRVTQDTVKFSVKQDSNKPVNRLPFKKLSTAFSSVRKLDSYKRNDSIAVIGHAGRYPQAKNLTEFWENLKEGKNCITEIPAERWPLEDFYHKQPDEAVDKGKSYSKWGGFIDGFADFDALFFNISPLDAANLDPQERLFLQCCWEVVEHAGYSSESLNTLYQSRVGVFVGITRTGFSLYGDQLSQSGENVYPHTSFASVANRVSYIFDFHGPSMPIDTMCSASLTALHEACEHIYRGECDLAIAGGVNLYLHPSNYTFLCGANMLSVDGMCKSFGIGGNGFVPGEGVAAVFLKKLSMAEADGDHIQALIRSTHVNHDGKTNGYTVPNPNLQAELIIGALEKENIDPRTISYIEAHGTGTELGDPIEVRGLCQAFSKLVDEETLAAYGQFCAIGSIKSNIGHLESAAGIAGLSKIILQLQHQQLVPSLHAQTLNPNIDFSKTPFKVQQTLEPWDRTVLDLDGVRKEYPRRAGLSSFGAGGANAHVIVEEYLSPKVVPDESVAITAVPPELIVAPALIVLSAQSQVQLQQQAKNLIQDIRQRNLNNQHLASIAYTLQTGRLAMKYRLAMAVSDMDSFLENMQKFIDDDTTVDDTTADDTTADEVYHGVLNQDDASVTAFSNNEELQELVDKWIERGKYQSLLEYWVKGIVFDWNRLYHDIKPQRIGLPTYPFRADRFWLPQSSVTSKDKGLDIRPQANKPEAHPLLTFEEYWHEQALDVADSITDSACIICFLSHKAHQQIMQKAFAELASGINLVFITKGDSYKKHSADSYEVCDKNTGSYITVLDDIQQQHSCVSSIFYLWPLEEPELCQDAGNIVYLLQAFDKSQLPCAQLLICGQYSNSVERCYLDSWQGFSRSLSLRLPDTKVRIIGKNVEAESPDITEWAGILFKELQDQQFDNAFYSHGKRQVCRVRATDIQSTKSMLKQQGTYLITGGAGELGMILAEHLCKTKSARIILTGRSELNSEKVHRLNEFAKQGLHIRYKQADVCDLKAMEHIVREAEHEFSKIDGVIHIAGNQHQQSVLDIDVNVFQEILAPKIQGTLVLTELFAGKALDFICYFSSSTAILGDTGSCDYAIGNRFQQSFAYSSREFQNTDEPATKLFAIAWSRWREGGMGFTLDENTRLYLNTSGQRVLESAEALEVFERILSQDSSQHLVIAGQPSRIYKFLSLEDDDTINKATAIDPDVTDTALPLGKTVSNKNQRIELRGLTIEQSVEWDIKQQISELLHISRERLQESNRLADLGFDSIRLTGLARQLSQFYQLTMTPSVFFSHPGIPELVSYFMQEHTEIINAFYQADTYREPVSNPKQSADFKKESSVDVDEKPSAIDDKKSLVNVDKISNMNINREPIAIIGMSGRFPQARNIDELWQLLKSATNAVTDIPHERMNWQNHIDAALLATNKSYQWLGVIPGVSEFDPLFFEISPKEAELMDPRQRLLLQEAWCALEHAGYGSQQLAKEKISMFVGVEQGDYQAIVGNSGAMTSNHDAILAARLSYHLNLQGPAIAINTACSSALVATHQACVSLQVKDCDTAIAAGVNLLLTPLACQAMNEAGMLSKSGKCFAFDQRADGLVPGEAVAVIVLKRLSQAQRDKDNIAAVICASGVNYDGRTNGITAPSGMAQARLLTEIYNEYQIDPQQISYIVTHGTGTQLGDPVEINALCDAFKNFTQEHEFCALTSTKTNLGHTFAASGLVSLIGLVQSMRHETIPASLHCEQNTDYVNWQQSPFYVNKLNKPWPVNKDKARLGAVSSFGMSGTNAHLVLADYQQAVDQIIQKNHSHYLLLLSAKTSEALQQKILDLLGFIEQQIHSKQDILLMAYTLMLGRQHFNHRCAFVVEDKEEACFVLQTMSRGEKQNNILKGKVSRDFLMQKPIRASAIDMLRQIQQDDNNVQLHREVLCALGEYYCQGYDLPWAELYGNKVLPRLALPTYPFSRKKYWLEDSAQSAKNNDPISAVPEWSGNESDYEKLLEKYRKQILDDSDMAEMSEEFEEGFDEAFYYDLLASLVEDEISIDMAVKKTTEQLIS